MGKLIVEESYKESMWDSAERIIAAAERTSGPRSGEALWDTAGRILETAEQQLEKEESPLPKQPRSRSGERPLGTSQASKAKANSPVKTEPTSGSVRLTDTSRDGVERLAASPHFSRLFDM